MMENKNNEFPLCCDCVFQAEIEFDGKDYWLLGGLFMMLISPVNQL